jgi:glycosyltransferase involved in cell wall biosynthesis
MHKVRSARMRIALVSPLIQSVPPRFYGGTERVGAYLANSLGALGHRVTVFASGDSTVDAEVVPVCAHALRLDPSCQDALPHLILDIERVLERVENFDIGHFHTDFCHFSAFRRAGVPWLNTVHGRLDLPDLPPLYAAFPDVSMVSISNAQRAPLPDLNWLATVHHGLPRDRDRSSDGRSTKDGGQGRPSGPGVFRAGHPAAARPRGGRVHRRDR